MRHPSTGITPGVDLGLAQGHLLPFGASHLPIFQAATERERTVLTEAASGLPQGWALSDRVLVVIEPAFRKDIERFYRGAAGDIATLLPPHILARLDEEWTKKALTIVYTLRRLDPDARAKAIHGYGGRRIAARPARPPRGEPATGHPHVVVRWVDRRWSVELAPGTPARWTEAGGTTLRRVVREVVDRQARFLEKGRIALVPMSRRAIADALGLAESTVSRVAEKAMLQTPLGPYLLSDLFVSGVQLETGGEASIVAVKAVLAELVQGEEPSSPLTDQELALQLKQYGFVLARRTVSKYREALGFPVAGRRRRAPEHAAVGATARGGGPAGTGPEAGGSS